MDCIRIILSGAVMILILFIYLDQLNEINHTQSIEFRFNDTSIIYKQRFFMIFNNSNGPSIPVSDCV